VMSAVLEDDVNRAMRQQFTRTLSMPTLFNSMLTRKVDDARGYALFNSALLTDKKGSVVGRFDKQYLLAFGEYLPFGETFPKLYEWSPHTGHFQAGTSFKPLSLGDRQIAVVVCYEDVLPAFVNREMREGEPELIANLTNDAWFGDSTEPWIHLALAKLRAVEQRKFFVRSTNSGVSAFVDPVGRVISHTKTFEEVSQRATLRWLKGKTPYTLWGDGPWWLATFASFVLAFRRRGSQRAVEPGSSVPSEVAPPPPTAPEEPAARPETTPAAAPEPANEPLGATAKPGFPKAGDSTA